jgi:zinc transport system substrate-binding protein
MGDAGTPVLLIPAGQSEHATTLRPSTAQAIVASTLVFRIARGFEASLDKPLDSLAAKTSVIELARAPGVALLPVRAIDGDEGSGPAARPGDLFLWADLHIWLDPVTAKAMSAEIVRALSAVDPAHAAIFAANGMRQAARLDALNIALAAQLQPLARIPFVVFHDAYQYFEHRYPLNQVDSVEVSPERAPSARHLAALRAKIKATGAVCVFAEPQFEPKLIPTIVEGLPVRTGVLDPLGASLADGPDQYFSLMTALGNALQHCLKP